jgi:hypothetical protein
MSFNEEHLWQEMVSCDGFFDRCWIDSSSTAVCCRIKTTADRNRLDIHRKQWRISTMREHTSHTSRAIRTTDLGELR